MGRGHFFKSKILVLQCELPSDYSLIIEWVTHPTVFIISLSSLELILL